VRGEDKARFVETYAIVVASTWSDEEFARALISDPRAAIRRFGLVVDPPGEVVVVDGDWQQSDQLLGEALRRWEQGEESGRYELLMPRDPSISTEPIDENDLDQVVAGVGASWSRLIDLSDSNTVARSLA
jgi:hypothetical protein